MSEEVVYVNEDDSFEVAAQLMSDYQIRCLPVIDRWFPGGYSFFLLSRL